MNYGPFRLHETKAHSCPLQFFPHVIGIIGKSLPTIQTSLSSGSKWCIISNQMPGTQIDPCFDWELDLGLEGSNPKIEDKQVPGE